MKNEKNNRKIDVFNQKIVYLRLMFIVLFITLIVCAICFYIYAILSNINELENRYENIKELNRLRDEICSNYNDCEYYNCLITLAINNQELIIFSNLENSCLIKKQLNAQGMSK